ncbi:E2 ligase fold family C protein [Hymenobacter profundi]|uniref:E2 ligase fold family C protein n=1 Tax=Hymenobacter profundi TaxID=1982110 RepID=A0ABS6WUG5_9BACT|nr:E2 ligase fold family C protein [Hymenobacter profundi]MBW3127207.1 E2 ligase fold family C protein [Hymenobacter profundi]
MALANFFEKAALAASQVLRDFDRTVFAQQLESNPVLLAFDGAAIASSQGRATIDLSARLLGRLYPIIMVQALDHAAQAYVPAVEALLQAINPKIDLHASRCCVALVVGDTALQATDAACPTFYVGSLDWLALFSPNAPVSSGSSSNPFGAGAAACLGVANVFRTVFAASLPHAQVDSEVRLSLLTYDANTAQPAWPEVISLSDTILVGVGAIGNGAVWALSQLIQAEGTLVVVDDETIDLSNLQRYALATQDDINLAKVMLAIARLGSTKLTTAAFEGSWSQYLGQRSNWVLPRVAVAVDSAAARISIQSSLPRRITNAWTQSTDLGISRHPDFIEKVCLACLYMPKGQRQSESEMVASALKLPELEVRELLYRNVAVDAGLAERIAVINQQPVELLLPFVGRPLRRFYQETVCGGVLLTTEAGHLNETPMAFQSALAGVMLAAELVIEDLNIRPTELVSTTRINLLQPLGAHLNIPVQKQPGSRCFCHDKHFQQAYRDKYLDGLTGISYRNAAELSKG